MDEYSIELAISLAGILATVGGAIISILLEKWPALRNLWDKVPSSWKPVVLFFGFQVLAPLPLLAKLAGAPEWSYTIMRWVPTWAQPTAESFVFAAVVGIVAFLSSQTVYFKEVRKETDY